MLEDGVYFSLDEKKYHADPALGSTDIRRLRTSPPDFWWNSKMNPARPADGDTPSRQWGRAFHKLVLEGYDAFKARYHRMPDQSEYPNALITADDVKKRLVALGLAVSGKKDELIARLIAADPHALVWDVIVEKAATEAGDREQLKPAVWDEIVLSSQMITKNPRLRKAFEGGTPELSVIWTRPDGVRCKARFDYTLPRTTVDLKSFRSWREKPIQQAIIYDQIAGHRYDIQAAHYMEGRKQAARLISEERVFGLADDKTRTCAAIVEMPEASFTWVFYQAEGAPFARAIVMRPGIITHLSAVRDIEAAIEAYKFNLDLFGSDIWVDLSDPHVLDDSDMPVWLGVSN